MVLALGGGVGGFAIGRATTGTAGSDQDPSYQDRQPPPGFENGTPPDLRGDGGPAIGDQNGDQNGGTGT